MNETLLMNSQVIRLHTRGAYWGEFGIFRGCQSFGIDHEIGFPLPNLAQCPNLLGRRSFARLLRFPSEEWILTTMSSEYTVAQC